MLTFAHRHRLCGRRKGGDSQDGDSIPRMSIGAVHRNGVVISSFILMYRVHLSLQYIHLYGLCGLTCAVSSSCEKIDSKALKPEIVNLL